MEPHESYTRLLGLALRGGNLVSGNDAVQAAVYAGRVRLLLLSADASPRVCRDAERWAERGHCLCVALPCDKAELGHALGHGTVAVAALTDTGLANAVGERLAALDPERYAHLSERLQRKVIRAGERRAARARARPEYPKAKTRPATVKTKARPDTGKARTSHADPRPDTGKARTSHAKADSGKPETASDKPKARTTPTARPGNAKARPATVKAKSRPDTGAARKADSGKPKAKADSGKPKARPGGAKLTPKARTNAKPRRRKNPET
ncbi:MAG: hypothetical protein IJT31_03410 [Oscillibacter sp.]|nr:hypothetical protein [Oscillibacter sp.]